MLSTDQDIRRGAWWASFCGFNALVISIATAPIVDWPQSFTGVVLAATFLLCHSGVAVGVMCLPAWLLSWQQVSETASILSGAAMGTLCVMLVAHGVLDYSVHGFHISDSHISRNQRNSDGMWGLPMAGWLALAAQALIVLPAQMVLASSLIRAELPPAPVIAAAIVVSFFLGAAQLGVLAIQIQGLEIPSSNRQHSDALAIGSTSHDDTMADGNWQPQHGLPSAVTIAEGSVARQSNGKPPGAEMGGTNEVGGSNHKRATKAERGRARLESATAGKRSSGCRFLSHLCVRIHRAIRCALASMATWLQLSDVTGRHPCARVMGPQQRPG